MKKNAKSFLKVSFVCMVVLCIAAFLWVSRTMTQKSQETVKEIGEIYMQEMSWQLQQKFSAIIDLRLSQVEGIRERTKPQPGGRSQGMLEDLALSAGIRNFTHLGLYAEDGTCEGILGDPIEIVEEELFLQELKGGGRKAGSGYNENGERLLLLGIDAVYEMKDGEESVALVAGMPMTYLQNAMVLDDENSLMFTHVISKDGSFVIRTGDAYRENYFDRMLDMYEVLDEKTPEQYVAEFQAAIAAGEDYSAMIMVAGMHRHIYCSPLPNSEWYLVSVMPYGVLDDAVSSLGSERVAIMVEACLIVLSAIVIIFILYYRLSQDQMRQLDALRDEAVRANKAKSEFLSNMSHDIRTPMNGIVGMTTIAIANLQDIGRVEDCLKKISLSSRHLLGLINDVLDMSKIESGKLSLNMELLSLKNTMESIVNIVQSQIKAKSQHFDIFISNIETEEVYCDGVRLNQILINLLSNAIKFTPEDGTVNVYLEQEASPRGINYVRCRFVVKDTGIGMTEEFQKEIFETFTREKNAQVQKTEGTGLGMAITKYIVEAMEGSIQVKSAPGKGSEFLVILDLEKAKNREESMKLPPWNVLVVDNNEALCSGAVSVLKELGIHAEYALNGKSAVQMAEEHHRGHKDYAVVLLDWKMPDMDGLETTRQMRKHLGDEVPILIISAYDWSDIEQEARAAGARGFISKPLFKSNLYLGLSRCMEEEERKVKAAETGGQEFAGKRILLAEDNDLNWEIAEELLSEAGFKMERAENGQDCVEKFKNSEIGYYDVILMDIRMPVMSGYEAAVAIRAMKRPDAGLPIIAMTADAFSEDIQRCLECGMNAHISKPIDVQLLLQHLRRFMK